MISVRDFVDIYVDLMYEHVQLYTRGSSKIQLCTLARYIQATDPTISKEWSVSTRAQTPEDAQLTFNQFLESKSDILDNKISEYCEKSSGWVIDSILYVSMICSHYEDFCRLEGRSYIPTPNFILNKHCTINVQNSDQKCFLYSILAILKAAEITVNRNRVTKYIPFLSELKYNENEMPMRLNNILKFERENLQLCINVIKCTPMSEKKQQKLIFESFDENENSRYYLKHPCFDLIYRSRHYQNLQQSDFDDVKVINLLLISDKNRFHYIGVTDLNKLLNCHANINGCANQIRGNVCETCLRMFSSQAKLAKHKPVCLKVRLNGTIFTLPKSKTLQFTDWSKMIPVKFIAYADFESVLEPNQNEHNIAGILQKHKPVAASFLLVGPNSYVKYEEFFGVTCIEEFLARLEHYAKFVKEWYELNANVGMRPLSFIESRDYISANCCYLCQQLFGLNREKVQDHDHFNGKFLGAACKKCNLARRIRKPFLPVAFHNLKSYDLHHILKYAVSKFKHWELQCIAQKNFGH